MNITQEGEEQAKIKGAIEAVVAFQNLQRQIEELNKTILNLLNETKAKKKNEHC